MEQEENNVITVIKSIGCGIFVLGILAIFILIPDIVSSLKDWYDEKWKLKYIIHHILSKLFPKLYTLELLSEKDIGIPKVNNQCLIIIENLPKSTTPKDLVKTLGLKDLVQKKLMKVSVAADRKGNCAGLAVALVPRYCLYHSSILTKHNSSYQGKVIKVREVKNRKINLLKQVSWLSSENWDHVGFHGRYKVYADILRDVTTQFGYYLIDGGSYIQYSNRDTGRLIEESAALGIDRIVIKVRPSSPSGSTEVDWCKNYPGFLFTTVGNGPDLNTSIGLLLEHKTKHKYVAAIGECEIISSTSTEVMPPLDKQKMLFRDRASLASKYKKPLLVITNRKLDEILDILEEFPDVIACLTIGKYIPSETDLYKWTEKGHYLGVTGAMWTKQKENFWIPSVLKNMSLDKIILCSNSPFLNFFLRTFADRFKNEIKYSEHFKNVSSGSIDLLLNRGDTEDLTEDAVEFEPKGLCVVLELLASCVNKPPIALAQIVNTNAERFYKFDTLASK